MVDAHRAEAPGAAPAREGDDMRDRPRLVLRIPTDAVPSRAFGCVATVLLLCACARAVEPVVAPSTPARTPRPSPVATTLRESENPPALQVHEDSIEEHPPPIAEAGELRRWEGQYLRWRVDDATTLVLEGGVPVHSTRFVLSYAPIPAHTAWADFWRDSLMVPGDAHPMRAIDVADLEYPLIEVYTERFGDGRLGIRLVQQRPAIGEKPPGAVVTRAVVAWSAGAMVVLDRDARRP